MRDLVAVLFKTKRFMRGISHQNRQLKKVGGYIALSLFLCAGLTGCSQFGEFKPAKMPDPDTPQTDGLVTGEKGQLEYEF